MSQDVWSFINRISATTAANYMNSFVRSGIDFNNKMMEGPIEREQSMADLEEITRQKAVETSPEGIQWFEWASLYSDIQFTIELS